MGAIIGIVGSLAILWWMFQLFLTLVVAFLPLTPFILVGAVILFLLGGFNEEKGDS